MAKRAFAVLGAFVAAQVFLALPAGAQVERRTTPRIPDPRAGTDLRVYPACDAIAAPRPKQSSGCDKTQVCKQADGKVSKVCTKWTLIR
jgi:hypothetical protein